MIILTLACAVVVVLCCPVYIG